MSSSVEEVMEVDAVDYVDVTHELFMESTDFKSDIEQVLQVISICHSYLDVEDLCNCRLVSSTFNQYITRHFQIRDRFLFHVNGTQGHQNEVMVNDMDYQDNVQNGIHSLLVSQFQWTNIKFSNMDLENDFLSSPTLFDKFRQNCLKNLNYLSLDRIFLPLGRFYELLTFCLHLKELKIVNCSSLSSVGMEIVNWSQFVPYFSKRIKCLKRFTLMSMNPLDLNLASLEGWLTPMRNLVMLNLQVGPSGELPMLPIVLALNQNASTLRQLVLLGPLNWTLEFHILQIPNLQLRNLRLGYPTIMKPILPALSQLLRNQMDLRTLELIRMELKLAEMEAIASIPTLNQLIFEDIVISKSRNGFHKYFASMWALKDLKIISNDERTADDWHASLACAGNTFRLNCFTIGFNDAYKLSWAFNQSWASEIKTLIVSDIGKFAPVQPISMTFFIRKCLVLQYLVVLQIINSDLKDEHFQYKIDGLTTKPFHSLEHLKFVNFSNTNVGDGLLATELSLLPKLEILFLERTQITYNGLLEFGSYRNSIQLQPIKCLSITHCSNLESYLPLLNTLQSILGIKDLTY